MTLTRGQFLTIGTVALIAMCYVVAAPISSHHDALADGEESLRHALIERDAGRLLAGEGLDDDHEYSEPEGTTRELRSSRSSLLLNHGMTFSSEASPGSNLDVSTAQNASSSDSSLPNECLHVKTQLLNKFPSGWRCMVRPPYVICGDFTFAQLDATFRQTILPTSRALALQYFDRVPKWPITIVLCSDNEKFLEAQRSLNQRERSEYSGLYSRSERCMVVNLSTGEGTLAHELTHALGHADFPELPEWLDEGLASLHEECEFSADGLRLIGLENWRRAALANRNDAKPGRSLFRLAGQPFGQTAHAHADYAYARYFCLFLQEHGLLEPLFRKIRFRASQLSEQYPDMTTSQRLVAVNQIAFDAVLQIFAARSSDVVDAKFENWLSKYEANRAPISVDAQEASND